MSDIDTPAPAPEGVQIETEVYLAVLEQRLETARRETDIVLAQLAQERKRTQALTEEIMALRIRLGDGEPEQRAYIDPRD